MIFWYLIMACMDKRAEEIPVVDADEDGFLSDVDCDDQNPQINSDSVEICNGIDDDCDSLIDDADLSLNMMTTQIFYRDGDGDGFGFEEVQACALRDDLTENNEDCDDSSASINPTVEEVCNEIDDNCDDVIDTDAIDRLDWFRDIDGDGFGDINNMTQNCKIPAGFVADNTDCDDVVAEIHPQAIEICNFVDDNCDGLVDDLDPNIDWSTGTVFFLDEDGDDFGVYETQLQRCLMPEGYSDKSTDCNDVDAAIHPLAIEVCDDIDNDCVPNSTETGLISAIIAGGEISNITMNQIYASAQTQELFFCTGAYSVSIQSSANLDILGIGNVSLTPILGSVLNQTGADLSMKNITIEGSISLQDSTVQLEELSFSQAQDSAIIINGGDVSATAISIENGEADYGGGIYLSEGSLSLVDSQLKGNTATHGGGLYAQQGSISLLNTKIYENTASFGGGVSLEDSSLTCTGQTTLPLGIYNNTGYGMWMDSTSSFVAVDCDVSNSSPEDIHLAEYSYFAGDDRNFSCAQGICGNSVAYSVSGLMVDAYSNNNAFRANIYDVVGYPTLDSFDIALNFSFCDVNLVLYTRADSSQPWELLYEESDSVTGGTGWLTSGTVGIPLLDGEQLLVGAGWVCDSAPDYSSYTPMSAGYGVGQWSGMRVVETNYEGLVDIDSFSELSSNYLYQQRLYVTSLY